MKVNLNVQNFDELKAIPHIKEILVLSQIWNAIRSAQRLLILVDDATELPTKKRDTFYSLISISSLVYEGMKRANSIIQKIAVSIPQRLHTEVNWLRNEVEKDKKSFYKIALKPIRDNIGFHFNSSITENILKNSVQDYPPTFSESLSEKKFDLSFLLADSLTAQFLPASNDEQLKILIIKLGEYANRLCDSLDVIIGVMISNYVVLKET